MLFQWQLRQQKSSSCVRFSEYFERLSTNYFFSDYYLGKKIANGEFVHYPNEKWFPIEDPELLPNGILDNQLLDYFDPNQELTPDLLVDVQRNDERALRHYFMRQSDQKQSIFHKLIINNLYVLNECPPVTQNEARVQGAI